MKMVLKRMKILFPLFQRIVSNLNPFSQEMTLQRISRKKYRSERYKRKKINIGTDSSPKCVNLGVDCTYEEVDQYASLFIEYFDVLSWIYDHLKEYDKSIFQHILPLREGTNPFK
jgi:hypothetical protein